MVSSYLQCNQAEAVKGTITGVTCYDIHWLVLLLCNSEIFNSIPTVQIHRNALAEPQYYQNKQVFDASQFDDNRMFRRSGYRGPFMTLDI